MSIVNLIMFLGVLAFAVFSSNYLAGLVLVLILMTLEIFEHGMAHSMFLVMCELTFVLFVIKETKTRKDDSPLLKYNPLYKNNVLPRKVQLLVCGVFLFAFVVRLVTFFHSPTVDNRIESDVEYQRSANAFINKIVIAHKTGEDYHSVANCNPFTNDVFVCKVVALLEYEYGRVDNMSQSITAAMKSVTADRGEKLRHLSEECIKESSNVVQRINAADIGEMNASKMASDFSAMYIRLHQKCSKSHYYSEISNE